MVVLVFVIDGVRKQHYFNNVNRRGLLSYCSSCVCCNNRFLPLVSARYFFVMCPQDNVIIRYRIVLKIGIQCAILKLNIYKM